MNDVFNNLFIFEIANNHEGSVEHGKKIIDAMAVVARNRGIQAGVKFQYRDLDTFIHPEYKERQDVRHIPRFFKNRLTSEQFRELVEYVRTQEMVPIVTPFDEISVQQCLDHNVEIIKVASCSANDWPLLEVIAKVGKPVIVSTGGLTIAEIDNVYNFLKEKHVQFAMMHCVAVYPTPPNLLQLSFMSRMMKRYPEVPIGYSGHEAPDNLDIVKACVALDATLLERHVGIPTETITLNAYSMNPAQTDEWVGAAQSAQEMMSDLDDKDVTAEEEESLSSLKRGVYAKHPITEGQNIKADDVFFAMPCVSAQITSGEFGRHGVPCVASRNYAINEAIKETIGQSDVESVREFMSQAKGMLNEAGVHLCQPFRAELSHHYGIREFPATGAVILTVINREYCKKILIMLPGQSYPRHKHEKKEEMFHLLSGDLRVELDDEVLNLTAGETLLIDRGRWHAFTSIHGAIIEEVSTTHHNNDSFYQDESINTIDPTERKTILEDW